MMKLRREGKFVLSLVVCSFFFQAEDGIRDIGVTGVQTCALPIYVLKINYENLEVRSKQTSDVTGLPTGFRDLDKITTGLHPDQLIILAARPAVGDRKSVV